MSILDQEIASLQEYMVSIGEKPYRANQVFDWIYKKGIIEPALMTNLPLSFRERLSEDFKGTPLQLAKIFTSTDKSTKGLFYGDGINIESVSIPADDGRTTFCLSTQAGCQLGCNFCATGKIRFVRNLTAGEMVSQVLLMQQQFGRPDNLVLMGMGEGLLNLDEVDKFIRIITCPKGFALSERRITLSTAGMMDELMRFHILHPKAELAVSLNAADDNTRALLMPFKGLSSFSAIIEAIPRFDCEITLEYVLLDGVNDSPGDADRLAAAIIGIRNTKLNLIRYNETVCNFSQSSMEKTLLFQKIIRKSNIICFIRKSSGADISAACGQLVGKNLT